ncbi:lauroyl-Kdo(2)-lipid IV(A) myristoyltransferase [Veronia pacifica]|uniref:Lipid A biosynthesis acyltransferase n=1 Tax=Veronia pacifica TaxID=1080227 RepID=A0A1C3EGS4_9GAMM|nr:lauroyl-Kdo(2)-lipid IV(A) myristoyltransferase [Veronia pacifica]ODA32409.1 lipid A biosynthesis (KDO)2-(lauroyl)-lipid IVA acyltransferase [Veronia pacifica]
MSKTTPSAYSPQFEWAFLHPKYWGSWLGIALAAIMAFIPFRARDTFAAFLAKRLVKLNNSAKKRAVINLKHCFPEKSDEERFRILEQSYVYAGCILFGFATILVRSKAYLAQRTVFKNDHILTDLVEKGEKIILLVPHTWSIDYPAVQLASRGLPIVGLVKRQSNPLNDWLMNAQRLKYGGCIHERSTGIKPFLKSIREGFLGYYLPDQDHGPDNSVFVPFLGAEKATLAGLGKLSRLGKAKVVPLMSAYNRETGNFEVIVKPPLENFPTGDDKQDAKIMNACLEDFIKSDPAQYMWIINLLRTRPDGSELY